MASNFPPKKNVAFTMYYFIHKSDGTIIANPTLTGSNVHVDGNTTEVTDSTLAVVDSTTGLCSIVLAQATMNGDQIDGTITSSSTGAVVYTFKLMTAANTQDEIVTGTVKAKVETATVSNDAITAAAIAAGAIDNATFAADVGSTAYATNVIALAVRKVLDELNLDHLAKTATAAADMTTEVADNSILSRMLANGDTSAFDPSTDGLQPLRDSLATASEVGVAVRDTAIAGAAADSVGAKIAELDTDIAALTEAGIKKNTECAAFSFAMFDSTDHVSLKSGLTVTATRSLDGAAFGACANAVSEIGTTGVYKITLAAADTNADIVVLKFTATGADVVAYTIKTSA